MANMARGDRLGLALAQAGLIQFGRFVQTDDTIWPVAVHLRWLPSYPALLRWFPCWTESRRTAC